MRKKLLAIILGISAAGFREMLFRVKAQPRGSGLAVLVRNPVPTSHGVALSIGRAADLIVPRGRRRWANKRAHGSCSCG
ncbi:MAG: hypothetical protein KatS3mg109_1770 [Pirellulaceae bacterium]|nr:MAG: hypothetical protein KatS3mg109_1770 [Pirellulaceae bacterium]